MEKPAAPRVVLVLLAGVMWTAVGAILCWRAWGWLKLMGLPGRLLWGMAGAALALGLGRFGFGRLAQENIERIRRLPARACLFAFQEWKSYPLVIFMMGLGLALRGSPLPRIWLAVLYLAIGGGLGLASLHYYAHAAGHLHGA